jgi:hypothetical protein
VRPLLEELDADAGMADMFEDFEEGAFPQGMDPWGRHHELGAFDFLFWTSSDAC